MERELRDILKTGKDWEKFKTMTPGLRICKIPGRGSNLPTLAVLVNPADSSGNPTKKKDLYVRSISELEEFRNLMNSEKIEEIIAVVDTINKEFIQDERVLDI